MNLPEKFVGRVMRDLGAAEGGALCAALDSASPVSVRLNPLRPAGGDSPALPVCGTVPWCDAGRYLDRRPSFTLDPAFHAGAYYVQEPASQFVGHLLGGRLAAGARILDLCAAPGGKTTLYASLAGDEGLVVANEIDRRRAQVLADNVRKWGSGNVAVTCCDAARLGELEGWFDVVAVDAPCSGEGMFRKDDGARGEWSESNVRLCASRQEEILRHAWRALRPGGMLLYSTCTFNRDENEGSLERLLAQVGEQAEACDPVPVGEDWGIECGSVGVFRTYRFYPHRCAGEGFFAAAARKSLQAEGRVRLPRPRRSVVAAADRAAVAELSRWVREPQRMRFVEVAGSYYAWPEARAEELRTLSDLLPVIYSGVEMGQIFKGKLKPEGALAFFAGLDRRAVPAARLDAEQALRFLRKQELPAALFAEGINLVEAEGLALGFVKRIGMRVNNMYPNSLRILMKE